MSSSIQTGDESQPWLNVGSGTSKHITETKFWNELLHGVYGPRMGGARIIVDAEDAATGVGKTGLAVALALLLSRAFGYTLTKEDLTLSGREYLQRWRRHPDKEQPSVLILDELSGAGAGDARRSQAGQNVDLGRSWQLMRKKRIVSIVTLPHWYDADKRMRRFADYRLWCLKRPIGYFRPYAVGATFDEGEVRTKRLGGAQRIRFPNLDGNGDEVFRYLATLKDDLLDSEFFDADELTEEAEAERIDPETARRQQKIENAQRMRNKGYTIRETADAVGMSPTWVNDNTEKPEAEQDD